MPYYDNQTVKHLQAYSQNNKFSGTVGQISLQDHDRLSSSQSIFRIALNRQLNQLIDRISQLEQEQVLTEYHICEGIVFQILKSKKISQFTSNRALKLLSFELVLMLIETGVQSKQKQFNTKKKEFDHNLFCMRQRDAEVKQIREDRNFVQNLKNIQISDKVNNLKEIKKYDLQYQGKNADDSILFQQMQAIISKKDRMIKQLEQICSILKKKLQNNQYALSRMKLEYSRKETNRNEIGQLQQKQKRIKNFKENKQDKLMKQTKQGFNQKQNGFQNAEIKISSLKHSSIETSSNQQKLQVNQQKKYHECFVRILLSQAVCIQQML